MARPSRRKKPAKRPRTPPPEDLETGVRFLTDLLDKISEGIVVVDMTGDFILFNRAARALFGQGALPISLGEIATKYGLYRMDRVTPLGKDELPVTLAMQGKTVTGVEMYVRPPGATIGRFLVGDAEPLWSPHGRQIGAIAHFRDTTEAVLTLQQLRLLERVKGVILPHPDLRSGIHQLVREILEGIGWPLGEIWETDGARKEFRLVEVVTTKAWPWKDANLVRRWERESRKISVNLQANSLVARAMASGSPVWLSDLDQPGAYARQKLGHELHLGSAVLVPVPTVDRHTTILIFFHHQKLAADEGLLTTFRTITDLIRDYADRRHSVEEMRRARSDAEGANRVKSAFLAHISHEIRTPLTAVIGMSDVLAESGLTPEQEEYVRTIRNGGKTLLAVINDLLDFAKIEAGRMTIERRPFDLNQVIEESIALAGVRAAERGIELEYSLPTDVPPAVESDPVRIQQILTNYLGNAIKFTERGSVELSVGWQPRPGGSRELIFSVRDTGIGIPEERLSALFQDFSQIDGVSPRRYEGSGLGLAISKGLAEALGGTVGVESTPGVGSTFRASVVVRAARLPAAEGTPTARAPAGHRRALLVGLSPFQQAALVPWLRRWGFGAVESRPTGELRARDRRQFDVALWDVDRTGISQDALRAVIRASSPFPFPVLALQWGTHGSEPRHVGTAPAVRILRKPLLLTAVHQALLAGPESKSPRPGGPPEARRAGSAGAPSALRVLVADDHPVNRSVIDRMLAQLHVTADVAADGAEAVEAARQTSYDLIFMDIEMPGVDGLEATRRIRTMEGSRRHARITGLSAHTNDVERQEALQAGMDDFLSKPIHLEELRTVIQRTVDQGPPARGPSTAPVVLDLERLTALAETNGAVDRAFLRRLFATFRTEARRHLTALEQAVAAGDAERLRRAAHALKSASGEVGAGRLRELADEIEQVGARPGRGGAARSGARRPVAEARRELRRVEMAWPAEFRGR